MENTKVQTNEINDPVQILRDMSLKLTLVNHVALCTDAREIDSKRLLSNTDGEQTSIHSLDTRICLKTLQAIKSNHSR